MSTSTNTAFGFFLAILIPIFLLDTTATMGRAVDDFVEKKPLQLEDFKQWSNLRNQVLSHDGRWVSFLIDPIEGDATLHIRDLNSSRQYSILRGKGARFTPDSQYVLYLVAPDPEQLKKLRKQKTPAADLPKQHLEILHLESGQRDVVPAVSNFTLIKESSEWFSYQVYQPEASKLEAQQTPNELQTSFQVTPQGIRRPEKEKIFRETVAETKESLSEEPEGETSTELTPQIKSETESQTETGKEVEVEKSSEPSTEEPTEIKESKRKSENKVKAKAEKEKKLGSTLVLRHLPSQFEFRFPFVTSHRFDEAGTQLAFATSTPEGKSDGVTRFDLSTRTPHLLLEGKANYGQVVFSKDGQQIAFTTDRDDYESEQPQWSLYHWQAGQEQAQMIVDAKTEGIPSDWMLASTAAPQFSEDGKRIVFRTQPRPEKEKSKSAADKDDEDQPKQAKLDIWHWQDPQLQPQQLRRAEQERNRTYQAVYDVATEKVFQLETLDIKDFSIDLRNPSHWAVGSSSQKYEKMMSWDIPGFSDWYLCNLVDGTLHAIAEKKRGRPMLSPAGKFVFWWDGEQKTWYCLPTETQQQPTEENPTEEQNDQQDTDHGLTEPVDLGAGIEFPLFNELHDTPSLPGSYGIAGWTDDDQYVLIYDRWDLWQVDPLEPTAAVCLTAGLGREEQQAYRYQRLDPELRTVDLSQPQILSVFDHRSKATGYCQWLPDSQRVDDSPLKPLIFLNESIQNLRKAKEDDRVIFTRSTFRRSPDLWASTLEFAEIMRLSRMNPQQDQYRWGTAELTTWTSEDGQELDGILYKPDGFDPSRQYPLMVYFYERRSDNLHTYHTPEPGRSSISFSFYVSRGYCLFVPDIPYTTGQPGQSAANAILPGVRHLIDQGFIDPARIGMQGHSWGGYQAAYLVTMTDMFACAEAGAPVSNMTSAYGGIRWESGMSRMFQYEKTQSRIGKTLWEDRDAYINNSPLFFADKINTPLLILHNDEDGAVPWYQGIELFVALRRLEKPCWMLNYNGDPHWVMGDANRLDFAQRMQQFFDHYLKDEPMPVWMAEGIPAVDKGKQFGFEYVHPEGE